MTCSVEQASVLPIIPYRMLLSAMRVLFGGSYAIMMSSSAVENVVLISRGWYSDTRRSMAGTILSSMFLAAPTDVGMAM